MSSLFHPDVYLPSLKEIDPEKLKAAGIRLVILDNDNTIAASRGQDVSPEAEAKRCRMHTILVDHSDRRDHIFGYVTTAACSILKLLIKDIPEKGEYYGNL